jgi:dephospho-CoA kinase
VVYIPQDKQVERLVERNGISREGAAARLRSQLPIDEKLSKADYVIYNDRSLEETRRQVEDLWQTLKDLQRTSPS